jgi:hypothetical protein
MKMRLFLMLSVMMAWGVVCAQDWTEADSLRLDQLLKTDGEIKLNPRALEELRENGFVGTQAVVSEKPWLEFDFTMPVLKLPKRPEPMISFNLPPFTPVSNGVTLTGDLAYHLTKYFTREYWDFRNKRNKKKTLEVLKNYDAAMPESLQSEK